MSSSIAPTVPDQTVTGKPHYEVLDGLRGSAAVMVVLFHIMGMAVGWADTGQWLHHAPLAVDFFFGLSGFVIAFAYDDRWENMTVSQFIVTRLIRLHPLVVLGAIFGLLSFLLDPFATNQASVPLATVFGDFALACLLIPYPALPNRWSDTHSLNSPAWSLLQEYIGNLAYALLLRRLGTKVLGGGVAVAAAVLIWIAFKENSVDRGPGWETMWMGTARMAFSFTLGLWLYRIRNLVPKLRLSWIAATVILAGVFAMPLIPASIPYGNGIYEAVVVILLFPVLILAGAHSNIGKIEMAACKLAGRISYPLYILHFPFLFLYMNFVTFTKPPVQVAYMAGVLSFVVVIVVSWLAVTVFDEPLRRLLGKLTRRPLPQR